MALISLFEQGRNVGVKTGSFITLSTGERTKTGKEKQKKMASHPTLPIPTNETELNRYVRDEEATVAKSTSKTRKAIADEEGDVQGTLGSFQKWTEADVAAMVLNAGIVPLDHDEADEAAPQGEEGAGAIAGDAERLAENRNGQAVPTNIG